MYFRTFECANVIIGLRNEFIYLRVESVSVLKITDYRKYLPFRQLFHSAKIIDIQKNSKNNTEFVNPNCDLLNATIHIPPLTNKFATVPATVDRLD